MKKNINQIIKEILKKFEQHQNGPVSETMTRLGLKYKKNYGVSILNLKEIAQEYYPNRKLAYLLSKKKIRESRILSYMVDDPEKLTYKDLSDIISSVDNHELAEQVSVNLLDKITIPDKILNKFLSSDNECIIITGYILFSRYAQFNKTFDDQFFENCLKPIHLHLNINSMHVTKAVARALRAIALRNDNLKVKVIEHINFLKQIRIKQIDLISEEVLPFLN